LSDFNTEPQADKSSVDTLLSVERAFDVVEMLADADDGQTLADISRRMGVNKAIALKLLNTLEKLAVVWRDNRVQRYYLTYRISNLGLRHLQNSQLLDQCFAVLKALAEETGELVRLAIVEPSGDRITWIQTVAGTKRSLQIDPNYSLEIGLNTHAAGKAWLSTMPFDAALKLMMQRGIRQLTQYSKVGIAAIKEDLEESARRGFAISHEENELGVSAIAAPIIAPTLIGGSECVATVSLAAPTNRMSRNDLEACGPLITDTAAHLAKIWTLEALARRGHIKRAS
jgi:IclR family transcriptional regulator, acetate operon repressor